MEHPRWGPIRCVESLRPIKSGEEIFTYYGYETIDPLGDPPEDYPWYFEALKALEEEEEAQSDRKKNKLKRRKSSKNEF